MFANIGVLFNYTKFSIAYGALLSSLANSRGQNTAPVMYGAILVKLLYGTKRHTNI